MNTNGPALGAQCQVNGNTGSSQTMPHITLDQIVALMGLFLAIAVYSLLGRYGVPSTVQIGATILSVLVVAIFWTTVQLGADDDDQ